MVVSVVLIVFYTAAPSPAGQRFDRAGSLPQR